MLRVNIDVENLFSNASRSINYFIEMEVIYSILGIGGLGDLFGGIISLVIGVFAVLLFFFLCGAVIGFICRYWQVCLVALIVCGGIYAVVGHFSISPAVYIVLVPILLGIYLLFYFRVIGYIFGVLVRSWWEILVAVVICYVVAYCFNCAFSVYPLLVGIVAGVLISWSEAKDPEAKNVGRN